MMHYRKHLVKLDLQAKGYTPFMTLYGFILFGLGVGYFRLTNRPVHPVILDYYWVVFLIVLAFELLSLLFVFPKQRIELDTKKDGGLIYSFLEKDELIDQRQIQSYSYWWNYNFDARPPDPFMEGDDDVNVPQNTGDRSATGSANTLRIHLKLIDENNEEILLYESLGSAESTPHWPYKLDHFEEFKTVYKCFYLKRLVKELELQTKGSYPPKA